VQEIGKEHFKKLKIYTLLDLVLITPTLYSDTTLSNSLALGKQGVFEVRVEEVNTSGGKLRIRLWLTHFKRALFATFFRATPYHYKLFTLGSTHVVQGRLEAYKGYLQMSQPKSVKEVGCITPKYTTVLKASDIKSLIHTYISEQNLYNEGLNAQEVAVLMRVHFPRFLDEVYENGAYRSEVVDVLKFVEAYNHLKKLRSKKREFPALYALQGDTTTFSEALPFALTPDQKRVISEIHHDLKRSDKATKRMVVGDVGSGKTMVILASVMIAYPMRSILMAPTSLLALQLYEEASKYLPKNVTLSLVMQGRERGDYRRSDFIIGTHALLYKEVLPQVALVMVDEQHRFGTKQRQMLESLMSKEEKKPHFIQFSATPIPRTQAMMESELVDVSLMTTTPFKRDVETRVIGKENFSSLLEHIKGEIAQHHQVLIIYPLIEKSQEIPYQSLEEAQGFWQKRFDNVYITHGKDKQKEDLLLAFREKGDILLATTVVEVGISLPRLTLIVIVGAERLGLATLHQLRGRVGRNGLRSWCYLYSNAPHSERLKAFSKTTNGFDIAKLDLHFRNSGDILDGTIQSGQKFKWIDMAEDETIVASAKERV
jgi:ATP-dependent DNA helicase RecG